MAQSTITNHAADALPMAKSTNSVAVRAAGCEADASVVANWKLMWLEAGMQEIDLVADFEQRTMRFIEDARQRLNYQTFVAVDEDGEIVGSASCQTWSGPVPLVVQPSAFKLGSVWAVYVKQAYRRKGIAIQLMESVKRHWRQIGCLRGVLLHASQAGRAVYESVGFKPGNLLLVDLSQVKSKVFISHLSAVGNVTVEAAGPEADDGVLKHWRQMWLEAGVSESNLKPDLPELTISFIENARATMQYQTFVARNETGCIIGSASCQSWNGPLPLVLEESVFKLGTVWAVYVQPKYRRQGVASRLMEYCMEYWRSIGCQKGILLHATDAGRAVYERLGFDSANGLVIDLHQVGLQIDRCREIACSETTASTPRAEPVPLDSQVTSRDDARTEVVTTLRVAGVTGDDKWLGVLAHALPQQLEAAFNVEESAGKELRCKVVAAQRAHGVFINPDDNWFTQNVKRFGGGFDMKQLTAQPGLLAAKFDRLSFKYDQWTVGNRSRVEDWLSRCARKHFADLGGATTQTLDVACGIGLPGHQLRLCGFRGHFVGTDISPGMIEQARCRGAHDALFVADTNKGLSEVESATIDLVLCTGALELLDHRIVLSAFSRVLRVGGQAWLSFQLENCPASAADGSWRHPTTHQNVQGLTQEEIDEKLSVAGLTIEESECCEDAFRTPSPEQDGSLLPVPYLFVVVRKRS